MPALVLRRGGVRAVLEPAAGGRVGSLRVDGFELLARLTPPGHEPVASWYSGIFALAPWAGHLERLEVDGAPVPLGDRSQATHGLVHDLAWQVEDVRADRAVLRCALPGRWPFAGHVEQVLQLGDHGARLELTVWSHDRVQPAAGGFHPWFVREPDGRLPELDLDVSGRLVDRGDGHLVPARSLPGGDPDPRGGRPWDDVFATPASDPRIRWADGPTVRLSSGADYWVVYERDPRAFCVEPWTAPPHLVGTAGGPTAAPGRPQTTWLELSW